jgi:hypothetical protein
MKEGALGFLVFQILPCFGTAFAPKICGFSVFVGFPVFQYLVNFRFTTWSLRIRFVAKAIFK